MINSEYKENIRLLIREMVSNMMDEMPGDGYVDERKLTKAEEKKKEELVKALKPKYGKTPKTYAIATAKAKELAEDHYFFNFDKEDEKKENGKEGEILNPRFGINASSKYLAIVYKDGEVDDNKYFDTKEEAQEWLDKCCNESEITEVEFTKKYDDSEHLTKKQKNLPDEVQKGIIDKASEEDIEEIRNLSHNAKRVAGAMGKENLPYHAPMMTNEDSKEGFTDKYDNNPALVKKQKTDLPDDIQALIIKSKEGEKDEEKEIDEKSLSFSYLKSARSTTKEKENLKKGYHNLNENEFQDLDELKLVESIIKDIESDI